MRTGWSDKEIARVLGVHPAKASQAITPAIAKFALLWLADPTATMRMLLEAVEVELRFRELADRRPGSAGLRRGEQTAARQDKVE